MHFVRTVRLNVTFYDAVNMIHDAITTANLFLYMGFTAKFMFDDTRNDKIQQLENFRKISESFRFLHCAEHIHTHTISISAKGMKWLKGMTILTPIAKLCRFVKLVSRPGSVFTNHSLEEILSFSPRLANGNVTSIRIG